MEMIIVGIAIVIIVIVVEELDCYSSLSAVCSELGRKKEPTQSLGKGRFAKVVWSLTRQYSYRPAVTHPIHNAAREETFPRTEENRMS